MAKKKEAPAGRLTITFSAEDKARIAYILAHERGRTVVTLNASDMVRLGIREAAKKRGYEDAATKGGAK